MNSPDPRIPAPPSGDFSAADAAAPETIESIPEPPAHRPSDRSLPCERSEMMPDSYADVSRNGPQGRPRKGQSGSR
jgi:hypothetical protein